MTIGDVRFLFDGSSTATCDLADGTCSDTIDADRVSDTELTPDFYATGAAARLRADAEARTGPTVAARRGRSPASRRRASRVPLAKTSRRRTARSTAGRWRALDASDLRVDLTSWSGSVDESAFSRPD